MRATLTFLACLTSLLLAPSAWAIPDFSPGPDPSRIVLNPTVNPADSQSLTWRTDADTTGGSVEYQKVDGGPIHEVEANAGEAVSFSGWSFSSRHHSATLTGLSPETAYRYRVGTGTHFSDWSTFTTATSGYRPWTMLYFGDVQREIATAWPPVGQMAFGSTPEARLSIFAGDLINTSSDDSDWGYFFAGLGEPARTINQVPVIGNHELSGDSQGIQFREHFTDPGNGPDGLEPRVGYVDYQGVRIITLDGNKYLLDDQVAFLKQALTNNPNRWTVVGIHQPIFSGEDGHDYPYIRDALLPVLEQYNVDLVLQGHDHAYSRGHLAADIDRPTGYPNGPVFVVSVAGPMSVPLGPADHNSYTDHGAVRVKAFEKTATYQPISFDGRTLTYRSVIAGKGVGSNATGQTGDLLDSFTITKLSDGRKFVSEGTEPPTDLPDVDPPKTRPVLKVKRIVQNPVSGRARAFLVADSDGRVKVTGRGVQAKSRSLRAGRPASLVIVPNSAGDRTLRNRQRLRTKVTFRFASTGGQARPVTRQILLRKRQR